MSKTNKNIPELRFPEFVKDGEWNVETIDELCEVLNNIRKPISSDKRENGSYPYYGASGIIDYVNDFLFEEKLLLVGEDGAKWDAYEDTAFLVEGKYWVNNHAHVLKSKNINEKFLESFLIKTDFNPYVTGAAPPKLTLGSLKQIKVPKPNSLKEQQKIASCLSSLDELIIAEEQRLDQLSEHKKGLMQNLFPQEGETVPKYRFPEFEKDGEWEEKTLGEIGNPLMCKRILKEQTTTNSENNVPFFKIGTFGKEADAFIDCSLFEEFKEKYSYPKIGDILISASGTIGRLVVFKGEPSYFQDSNIIWLGNDEKLILNEFLYYVYSTLDWQTSDGGVIRRLYNSDFKGMKISFPPNKKEQQKIASCLSSLDELIQAQTGRIEELKEHKKGLMQKLFPQLTN